MPTLAGMKEREAAKKKTAYVNPSQKLYFDLGFTARNRPEGDPPNLPTRITAQHHNKLGDLQIQYAAWREYAEDLHADATATWMTVKSDYDFLVAVISNSISANTVKDKANMVLQNQEVQKKRTELLNAETMVNLLAAKLASYTNALQVLSRELTRRGLVNV